jgi:hypothetical protein
MLLHTNQLPTPFNTKINSQASLMPNLLLRNQQGHPSFLPSRHHRLLLFDGGVLLSVTGNASAFTGHPPPFQYSA